MLILHDPDNLLHRTVELLGSRVIPAHESPARLEAILQSVGQSNHELRIINAGNSNETRAKILWDLICVNHEAGYLDHLKSTHSQWIEANLIEQDESVMPECFMFTHSAKKKLGPPKDFFARAGYYAFDMSTGIMKNSWRSILASANLAVEATNSVLEGCDTDDNRTISAVALCRPPGHHCDGQRAGGYCYINNVAVAVSTVRKRHAQFRVGVLDLDFHHGNGTQEIFYNDPNLMYVSIHGEDEFPYYTGHASEEGGEAAKGCNLNLPLKTGSSFEQYLEKLEEGLAVMKKYKPDFLLVSLGFDTFRLDPLGNFKIDTEDYEEMARTSRRELANIPTVILLEGGYVIEHLGPNLLSFIKGWEDTTGSRSE